MTEGSLKLTDTALISRSWTAITSTFPWHQSVIAFCQLTTFRGSYEALRRSVCSMTVTMMPDGCLGCQAGWRHPTLVLPESYADNVSVLKALLVLVLAASAGAC